MALLSYRRKPADLLTRGITALQLHSSTLWRNGHSWLDDMTQWPFWEPTVTSAFTTVAEEESAQASTSGGEPPRGVHLVIDINRYSCYRKLLRVTTYVMRFIVNCKNTTSQRHGGPLTTDEMRQCELKLIKNSQRQSYHDVIQDITSKIRHHPIVRQLRLYLDENGCIRCGGRIHNAQLPETAKCPYLLPPKTHLTKLMIIGAHYNQLHAGVAQTVTHLRQKLWIPSIRQHTRNVLRHCTICRKLTGKPYTAPDPPPLPVTRVNDEPPFAVTGVDFTGALYVIGNNAQQLKVYICLFTCASTRAVHLEIVLDLTEEAFLLAFRRFVSRRSLPRLMISDNATTYQAAANQMHRLCASQVLQGALAEKGTKWQFIPKRAPWYGGWWERLIGVTKTSIKKILGRAFVDLHTLQTVVTEVEAMMNDRPLTYVSSSRDDTEPLTTSHLLHGRRLTCLPFTEVTTPDENVQSSRDDIKRRAQRHALIIDQFRRRWKHEYLISLREYQRTSGNNNQAICVGVVVIVQDDFMPRLRWNLAVVDELLTGNDGFTRAARIRTSKGVTIRLIVKLNPLEIVHLLDGH